MGFVGFHAEAVKEPVPDINALLVKLVVHVAVEIAAYVLESGEYILRLGSSSRSTVPVGVLRLEREIVVSRHTHICPMPAPTTMSVISSAVRRRMARLTRSSSGQAGRLP